MARGRFHHSLDDKGRLSIPAVLRTELQQQDGPPFVTNLVDKPALALYAHDHWLAIEERLKNMSQVQPDIGALRRMLVSGATEAPIDGQGRILIPPYLREHAGLEREVTIAGVGQRIEIWDKARFDEELDGIRQRGHDVTNVGADLGL